MRPPACTAPGPAATPRTESSTSGTRPTRSNRSTPAGSPSHQEVTPGGPCERHCWPLAGRRVRVLGSSRDGAPENRQLADGSSYSLDDAKTGLLAAEGGEVREQYRRLREELRLLDLPSWLAGKLASILDHHLRLVSLALDLSYRRQTERIRAQRHRLHGLGPSAGDLLALRDRLTEVLGQRWWPTGHWEGEPNGHRQR